MTRKGAVPTPRMLACVVLAALIISAVLAGLMLPLDPSGINLSRAWDGPSPAHPCGRDGLGRDMLARLLTGTRVSLGIALASLGCALAVGVSVGSLAGWYGGRTDAAVMRGVDLMMGLRELALAIAVAAFVGPGTSAVILILGLGWSPPLIRFVRSLVLVQCGHAYVLAATALGAPPRHVLSTHILPNIAGPVAVRGAAIIGPMVQTEAALSFLGIGVQDPSISLGTLIRDGLSGLHGGPQVIVATTAMVFLVALTFTLLADELRDLLDPRCQSIGRPDRP